MSTDARHVFDQLIVALEKAAVHEVMALDAREREAEFVAGAARDVVVILNQMRGARFPDAPSARRFLPHRRIVARQSPVVRRDEIALLAARDRREVAFPGIGKEQARSALVKPLELPAPKQKDAAEHELGHAIGMLLGVGEPERAAPRAAEDEPALDAEVHAKRFDVRDQMPGRVVGERRVRLALAATALIEEHDAIALGVEEATLPGTRPAARSTVQEDGGLTVGVARLLEVERVLRRDLQESRPVRLNLGVEAPARVHAGGYGEGGLGS